MTSASKPSIRLNSSSSLALSPSFIRRSNLTRCSYESSSKPRPLQPLGQAWYTGGINPKLLAQLPLAYSILPGEQHQREPRASTYAYLSLKSTLHPPKGKAQRGEQRTALRGCLCYTLLVHHHSVARSFHII